jgi:SAM-dependent methyltransferase
VIYLPQQGIVGLMDILELREFYGSRLGQVTRRALSQRLRPLLGGLGGAKVMGLGYSTPYLADCVPEAETRLAFMLARQGVFRWPEDGAVQSALVEEYELPLLESVIDAGLVIHALEFTDAPGEMLKEIWRVLAPQGRLILVVPNRRGLWARFDSSPFGHGQPFSRPQLSVLLRDSQFSVTSWSNALYFPPSGKGMMISSASALEKFGPRLMPAVSGVLVVEAVKQVYASAAARRKRRLVLRPRPALSPIPTRRNASGEP